MGADNWSVCQKCRKDNPLIDEDRTEFREDYEFYIDNDGIFHACFHGKCRDCGFTFKFNHKENILK